VNGAGGAWRTISVALHADGTQYFGTLTAGGAASRRFGDEVERTTKRSGSAWTSFGKVAAAGAAVAGIALVSFVGASIRAASEFESRMSAVQAVSGATGAELDSLRSKALQLGADTSFSATQAASAMEELVKAGVPVQAVLNGAADATVNLAAAGEVDLTKAAEISANAMNQFGLSAQDLPRIADLVAGAANTSAIDVEQFGMSLSQAGAVASLSGASFDDVAVAITAMGNAGIVGSDAGTSLKSFLSRLVPTTVEAANEMERLGIITEDGTNRFFDAQGNLREFSRVAEVLQGSLKGLTKEQQLATLQTVFGSDAIRAAAVIADQGAAGWDRLAASMGDVSAADVAETRMNNLAGSVEKFKGSVETMLISSGGGFTKILKPIVDDATELVNKMATDPADLFAGIQSSLRPLLPFWHDLLGTGENIVEVLIDLYEAGYPVAEVLAQLGGAAILKGVTGLASAAESLTGSLADNKGAVDLLVKGLLILGAIKTFGFLGGQANGLRTSLWNITATVSQSDIGTNLGLISGGVRDVTTSMFKVPDAAERMSSQTAAGLTKMKAGFSGLTSSITSPTVAIAGLTLAIEAVVSGLAQAHKEADAAADALKPRKFDDRSLEDLDAYAASLDRAAAKAQAADDAQGGWSATLRGTAELLSPMENDILDGAIAAKDLTKESLSAAAAAEFMRRRYVAVSDAIGDGFEVSVDQVQRWVQKLNLDPATMSVKQMVDAINGARWAAQGGTPVTDSLADAYRVLGDETSSSTEKLDAWKDTLDAALGRPRDLFDAITQQASGLIALQETLTEGLWGGFGTDTEAGRANRDALSAQIANVQAVADAYADLGKNDEAAEALRVGREGIIQAGVAAGMSEQQITDYVDALGLTPGLVQTEVQLNGADSAQRKADALNATLAILNGSLTTADLLLNVKTVQAAAPTGTVTTVGPLVLPGTGPANRWGGVYSYASGGITPAHVAYGTRYKWAEPETGGEAFFPRFGDLARNEAQMKQVAGWYGGTYLPASVANAPQPLPQQAPRTPLVTRYEGPSKDELAAAFADAIAGYRSTGDIYMPAAADPESQRRNLLWELNR